MRTFFIAICVALALGAEAQTDVPSSGRWAKSIVQVEVARKQYDFYQPWTKRTRRLQKSGLVLAGNEVLTTADELFDRTLVRLQKFGRGRWYTGKVTWVDYHANLALITTEEAEFWKGLSPAKLGGAVPQDGSLQVMRWREGNLENRRAEFLQFAVRQGQLSTVNHAVLEVGCEIQGVGWGEPVFADSRVVGILTSQGGRTCTALPASFVRSILEARAKGTYRGLGYFHFYWQPAVNTDSLARLKLPGPSRGVLVIDVPPRPDGKPSVLKPEDIILNIDGFDIDIEGDYVDPEFGHVLLENLSTRNKWAGDKVKLTVWRDGARTELVYDLPKYEYTNALVPMAVYDQEPEYFILGGLVFQPLTDQYLQSWGQDWKRRAPFRLSYYREQFITPERPSLVILSQVLPDPYNIGYQDLRWLVLDKINGQPIRRLADLAGALEKSKGGFHIVEMIQSDSLRRVVLAAGKDETDATARVLKRYGIDLKARVQSQ